MKKLVASLLAVFLSVGVLYAQEQGPVKMSKSGICHAPGTSYYNRTKTFFPFDTIEECLAAGGRLPK